MSLNTIVFNFHRILIQKPVWLIVIINKKNQKAKLMEVGAEGDGKRRWNEMSLIGRATPRCQISASLF